jgi:hypothetical protein
MSTPELFRAKAAELTELADKAANSDDADALRVRERSFSGLADNEQWLADNPDKTVAAPAHRDAGDVVLAKDEDHILRCLGAALIMRWNELPRELQRNLFDHAGAMGEQLDSATLRRRIARFLHQHKDEDAGRSIFAGDRQPTA